MGGATRERAPQAKVFVFLVCCLTLLVFLMFPLAFSVPSASAQVSQALTQRIAQAYGNLPLRFERNEGQADPHVKFLSRGSRYTLFLTPTETVLSLRYTVAPNERHTTASGPGRVQPTPTELTEAVTLRMKLLGSNPAPEIAGFRELPGKVNYYIGNDAKKWRTHVSTFEKAVYRQAYPGIDLVFYGNQGRLEYDFIVSPGANPSAIALAFEGAEKMKINSEGDLVIGTSGGEVCLHKPAIYQEAAGKKQPVSGGFVVDGRHKVGFHVAKYNTGKPLIIDPVLVYSTYLGGKGDDQGLAIAADNAGNAYVTGFTLSSDFPVSKNAEQPHCGDNGQCDFIPAPFGPNGGSYGPGSDAFVAKIDTTKSGLNSLIYSTFLGGGPALAINPLFALDRGTDQGNAIAVDASGNAYVVGNTTSQDFPTTSVNNGLVVVETGDTIPPLSDACIAILLPCTVDDAFLSKFDPLGALVYSIQFGGQLGGHDSAHGIAVDNVGNAYVVGETTSLDFPITLGSAFQTTFSGNGAAFIAKFDTTKDATASLVYSSYFGTSNTFNDSIGTAIALDSANHVYVTGALHGALDSVPTTTGVLQTTPDSGFVAKFDLTKSGNASLLYSTYFPTGPNLSTGFSAPGPSGIAVDKVGNVYVTGRYDNALTFPLTTGAYDSCTVFGSLRDCGRGVFVSKLNATGSALIYSARLGGDVFGEDFIPQPGGIAVDSNGNAYITGTADYGAIAGVNGGPNVAAPFPGNLLVGDCEAPSTHCFADAYVTMLNPQGTSIIYSNLLSGSFTFCTVGVDTFGHGVAVDSAGNAYFAGGACSSSRFPSDFPTTPNAFQGSIGSLSPAFDAYVLKLGAVCAADVSNSVTVTRSGFSFNFTTGRFYQKITLTNSGSSPILDPISLVLGSLSANATLFNATGTTACAAPVSSPFINLILAGPLGPGASAVVVLQFTDPTRAAIAYTTKVFAGSGSR